MTNDHDGGYGMRGEVGDGRTEKRNEQEGMVEERYIPSPSYRSDCTICDDIHDRTIFENERTMG